MRALLLSSVLLATNPSGAATEVAAATMPGLREQLLRWMAIDQAVLQADVPERFVAVVQRRHTDELKEAVARSGWPTIAAVGRDGSQAAWLLVQHADADPAWQRRALALMEPLVERDEVARQSVAYLTDRVAFNAGAPQSFGTQGRCVARGRWEPAPIAAPDEVDARRARMRLPPLAEYRAMASSRICGSYTGAAQ